MAQFSPSTPYGLLFPPCLLGPLSPSPPFPPRPRAFTTEPTGPAIRQFCPRAAGVPSVGLSSDQGRRLSERNQYAVTSNPSGAGSAQQGGSPTTCPAPQTGTAILPSVTETLTLQHHPSCTELLSSSEPPGLPAMAGGDTGRIQDKTLHRLRLLRGRC